MNAEGFAPWCAEAEQICRQSFFADGFAVETSNFRGTFRKLDEPGCSVSHNYMGRTEVIPNQKKSIWYVQKKRICGRRLFCCSFCKLVVLGVSSSAMFFIWKYFFPFEDEDKERGYAGLAKFKWRFTELDLKLGAWPAPGVHGRVTTLRCWVADSGEVGSVDTNKMKDTLPLFP